MDIASFEDLLLAARGQPQPQRLLFVFASAGVSADSTPAQRARFEAGEGGELTPVMCVDKAPDEIADFAALKAEAAQFGKDWAVVFVAAMSGRNGRTPATEEADAPLQKMIAAIASGTVGGFMAFDVEGRPLELR